jgi:hypothetical protein
MKLSARAIFVLRIALSYYDDGMVTDERGDVLGNIYDEI